jgi:ribosome-binding factor A
LRINELVREIAAEEIERIDDERLELVAITSVEVEADLRHAVVWFDSLLGEANDDEVLEALGDARVAIQAAIGRQARMKRTPTLTFKPDTGVRTGERVDEILREHPPAPDEPDDA